MREKNKKAFETLSKFRCGRARRLIFERLAYARLVPKKKVIAGPGWRRGKVDASRWQLRREGNLLISRQMLSTEFKVSLSVRRKQWSNSTLAKLKIQWPWLRLSRSCIASRIIRHIKPTELSGCAKFLLLVYSLLFCGLEFAPGSHRESLLGRENSDELCSQYCLMAQFARQLILCCWYSFFCTVLC